MRSVAFLGPPDSLVLRVLRGWGTELRVVEADAPLDAVADAAGKAEWIVSHGYRSILPRSLLAARAGRIVNCHISLLPWNRGADPNLWSVLEDSPSGVTLHLIDQGVDTGPIVVQQEVPIAADDTFASSYERLQRSMADLFEDNWAAVQSAATIGRLQPAGGTSHRTADRAAVTALLDAGWETQTAPLRGILPRHPGQAHPDRRTAQRLVPPRATTS